VAGIIVFEVKKKQLRIVVEPASSGVTAVGRGRGVEEGRGRERRPEGATVEMNERGAGSIHNRSFARGE
jgi:hypothetical protein